MTPECPLFQNNDKITSCTLLWGEQLYPTASHKSSSIKSVFQAFVEEGKMKVESSQHLHHTCSIKTPFWISLMPLAEADVFLLPCPELWLEIQTYFHPFVRRTLHVQTVQKITKVSPGGMLQYLIKHSERVCGFSQQTFKRMLIKGVLRRCWKRWEHRGAAQSVWAKPSLICRCYRVTTPARPRCPKGNIKTHMLKTSGGKS